MAYNIIDNAIRSVYIVPGNQQQLISQAPKYGADAIIIDMQASLPRAEVAAARKAFADNVDALRAAGQRAVMLRIDDLRRGGTADVDALAGAPIDAIVVPNSTPEGIRLLGDILDEKGWNVGVFTLPETPDSMARSLELFTASDRIAGVIAGSGPRWGDAQRVLGFEWTPDGLETLFLRSQYALHARAAGLQHIIGCAWSKIEDTDGLRRHIDSYKSLGYTGYVALHPSQIAIINDEFQPSQSDIDHAYRVRDALNIAEQKGDGVIEIDGELIALQCGRDMSDQILARSERRH